jgi:hypothetical protein
MLVIATVGRGYKTLVWENSFEVDSVEMCRRKNKGEQSSQLFTEGTDIQPTQVDAWHTWLNVEIEPIYSGQRGGQNRDGME